MRTLVKSLKRLYLKEAIDKDHIDGLEMNSTITTEEKEYILDQATE